MRKGCAGKMIRQIKFRDIVGDTILGGIQLDNGDIICGCCGGVFEADDPDIEIIETYDNWVNISYEIIGE